ncbi:Protein HitA [Lentibacillus sp. JNUCC-1]|uniref:HIT family protein n=1 Tax=Lentibacillus sp. JNUCC-1 TaxID=2654513 RepID=UPI0012E7538D|nr:HIT family protein [Lentibacillus sp. JNUCC-1]MUV36591.1 Protein HitA [Lentibacillus sp. JNUCC-1]
MSHEDCIFCKIIDQELPSAKVYEDEHVYAFLDLSQVTKGHTLVIPKTHTKDIYNTSDDVAAELFARVPKIARAIKETYKPDGINLLNNNEKAAGQAVFHYHIHILPRYGTADGFQPSWVTHEDDYTQQDLQQIAAEINKHI